MKKLTGEEAVAILNQIGWTREDMCFMSLLLTKSQMSRIADAFVKLRGIQGVEEAFVRGIEALARLQERGEELDSGKSGG